MDISGILDTVLAFLLLILGFGFVIFVHELGHFAAAKAVGIKVTQFAIGFGHAVWAYRKGLGMRWRSTEPEYCRRVNDYLQTQAGRDMSQSKSGESSAGKDQKIDLEQLKERYSDRQIAQAGIALGVSETEYRLNWMPLGGYVKMLGQEDMNPTATSSDPRSFNRKPVWARALVISAGVIMNMIFALVFFTVCFMKGVEFPAAIVGDVVPGSPAATTYALGHEGDDDYLGPRGGARILEVGGEPVTDFMTVKVRTALAGPGETLNFLVEQDGEQLLFPFVPRKDEDGRMLVVGIEMPVSATLAAESEFMPQVMEKAGVKPGMRLAKAGNREVARLDQVKAVLAAASGQPVTLTFVPGDGQKDVKPVTMQVRAAPQLGVDRKMRVYHWHGLVPPTEIRHVAPDSPAEKAGLKPGDVYEQVGRFSHPTLSQIPQAVAAASGEAVPLRIRRGEKLLDFAVTPNKDGLIGVVNSVARETTTVVSVLADSPFAGLQLPPGSRITSVNGQPVNTYRDMQIEMAAAARAMQEDPEQVPDKVEVGYELALGASDGRPVASSRIELTGGQIASFADPAWDLPSELATGPFLVENVSVKRDSPVGAALLGIDKTREFVLQTYVTIARLFQGTVPASELRGPLGIAHIGTKTAERGWTYLLFFLGLISVNLAVINFLPIPIVDGGLMVFLIIEKIKGSPVSMRVQNAANIIGLVLIGSIFLFTLFHDSIRLFGAG